MPYTEWKQFVQDYLRFTKKDRVGVLVLLALIVIVVLLPLVWPVKKNQPAEKKDLEQVKALAAQWHAAAESRHVPMEGSRQKSEFQEHPEAAPGSQEKRALFYFDPNTLDAAGWQRLGLRPSTAATIMHYRARGGSFGKPADMSKIYGLQQKDYDRLLPYVRIPVQPAPEQAAWQKKTGVPLSAYPVKPFREITPVDINAADTAAFIALPGIGSKLAARIVHFREKLGGFYRVAQIAETYGLPDSTFRLIEGMLRCDPSGVKPLNINTADAFTLQQHPYIRRGLANAIVQYRNQHGPFTSVEEIQKIVMMEPALYQQVKPYLVLQ